MSSEPLRPLVGERQPERPIDPGVRIGHVHLKVADLERALGFYCGVLGFALMQRYGTQVAFIAAGGYHHHIGLNTWESLGGSPPPPGSTGLYHTAILYPTRAVLAEKSGLKIEDMVRSHWVYRKLRNFRAGLEAGISCLERAYGLARCTWRGLDHFKAYVWSSVVAYNLVVFVRLRSA